MKSHVQIALALTLISLADALTATEAVAQQDRTIRLGAFQVTAPEKWVRKQPQSRITSDEFAAPAVEGDMADGRFTVTAAGGSVDDNINRWIGQFKQPDGSATKDQAKISKEQIAGQTVHLVDISGTYDDRPPFAPGGGVQREKYRMLAAVMETKEGNFFLKFYGPRLTITENEKAFQEMVHGLKPASR
ncbi:MAG: hypothetical protein HY000_24140 [Planctomycetes bacterium]|nr:hypothetical protein [Planctomycetota bacterium]